MVPYPIVDAKNSDMWVVISDYKNAFDYFCLEKLGPDSYRVFLGGYEVIAYIEDFYDFDTNTHKLPAELLENDIETNADGLILGKNIVENESQNSQKFEQFTDPNLKIFLDSFGCDTAEILNWIEEELERRQ